MSYPELDKESAAQLLDVLFLMLLHERGSPKVLVPSPFQSNYEKMWTDRTTFGQAMQRCADSAGLLLIDHRGIDQGACWFDCQDYRTVAVSVK